MSRKIEPCSICEKYMDGVICEEKECPVAIMKEENERLKEKAKGFQELWCEAESDIRTERTEAIKGFVERLKKSSFECDVSFGFGREHYTEAVAVIEIDNLAKEMTEGA